MKKFFISVFFIVAAAGAGFFAGWVQFAVPPGSYGIVVSRSHGVDTRLARPGEFMWLWYRLIPTNVRITVFNTDTVRRSVNISSALPSGDTYAAFTGVNADFSWELAADFSFRLDPQAVLDMAQGRNFDSQESVDAFAADLAQRIEAFILRQRFFNEGGQELEELMPGASDAEIERAVESQFPQIRDFSFSVSRARFPDFALYRQLRYLFDDFVAAQREFISTALAQQAQAHITTQLRLGELERYGQLLERYPALLQFLALEMGSQN